MTPDRDRMDPLAQAEEAELARHRAREPEDAPGITSTLADADERDIESALRPKRLTEFTGQARVREQLSLILTSALRRGRPPDHLLLSGPARPGQDHDRDDRGRRARCPAAHHQRPGHRAVR